MHRRHAFAAALLLAACSSDIKPDTAVIDTLPGGVVRVMNSGPSEWQDTLGWKLVLDHTVQPAEGDPGELGAAMWIAVHSDGSVLVTENEPVELKLFGPDGKFLRNIGRDGDGPGEFRRVEPGWVSDTIVVQDNSKRGTVTLYSRDGTLIRSFESVCCIAGPPVHSDAAGRIRLTGMMFRPDRPFSSYWVWLSQSGERVDSLDLPIAGASRSWRIDQGPGGVATYGIPFSPYTVAESFRDGRIVFGFSDTYQLAITQRAGDTLVVFGRSDATAQAIPDSVRDAMWEQLAKRPGFATSASKTDLPTEHSVWKSLNEDGNGNIWIGRPGSNGIITTYDVFARDGVLRGTVAAPWLDGPDAPWRWSWNGDKVAVIDADANDLPRVRVYRVQR